MTKTRKRRKGGAFFGLVQGGTFSEGCGSLKGHIIELRSRCENLFGNYTKMFK